MKPLALFKPEFLVRILFYFAAALVCTNCYHMDDPIECESDTASYPLLTRAVPTLYFDWENVDWMPTPQGQSRIPTPWVGQGSLVGTYDWEIVNDHKAFDGWELLYSTFDPNAPSALVNPYFVLYNKYRGIMRVYIYLTTQFVTTSSQLQDGISIASSRKNISLLRFCGREFIHPDSYPTEFNQLQPKPKNGSAPMAANKWYMMQYELAYDPALLSMDHRDVQLCWWLNYVNVAEIKMQSRSVGDIVGTIGTSTATGRNPFSTTDLSKIGSRLILTNVDKTVAEGLRDNSASKKNSLNLPQHFYEGIVSSITEAAKSSIGDILKKPFSFLSAIIGGISTTAPTPISLKLEVLSAASGALTEFGSFPSSPISMWIPGTSISSSAVGIIPLYNKPLGVCNISHQPTITLVDRSRIYNEPDEPFDPDQMLTITEGELDYDIQDYSQYLIINPELQKIADVTIERQDIVATGYDGHFGTGDFIHVPAYIYSYTYGTTFNNQELPQNLTYYVRFAIKVAPHNGAPESIIYKTFQLAQTIRYEVSDETTYP